MNGSDFDQMVNRLLPWIWAGCAGVLLIRLFGLWNDIDLERRRKQTKARWEEERPRTDAVYREMIRRGVYRKMNPPGFFEGKNLSQIYSEVYIELHGKKLEGQRRAWTVRDTLGAGYTREQFAATYKELFGERLSKNKR
jgi:hypothetical protein